jgi:hypothetical protein
MQRNTARVLKRPRHNTLRSTMLMVGMEWRISGLGDGALVDVDYRVPDGNQCTNCHGVKGPDENRYS